MPLTKTTDELEATRVVNQILKDNTERLKRDFSPLIYALGDLRALQDRNFYTELGDSYYRIVEVLTADLAERMERFNTQLGNSNKAPMYHQEIKDNQSPKES